MAEENDNSQEKTEEATPRRLEKAREDGQTARSKELATMAVLIAGAGGLLIFGTQLSASMEAIMRDAFTLERSAIFDTQHMSINQRSRMGPGTHSLAPAHRRRCRLYRHWWVAVQRQSHSPQAQSYGPYERPGPDVLHALPD